MKDLEPKEIAKVQLEELMYNQRIQAERGVTANYRWTLSLAVANGASLAALAAKLIDTKSEMLTALLMPSAWLFVVGVACAGATTPIGSHRHYLAHQIWKGHTVAFREGVASEVDPNTRQKDQWLYRLENLLEWTSASCFVIGVSYPLAVLCHRYLTSGHGFFPSA